ncbi:MAG: hypothetical protein QGI45_09305 [Myxococcota bacterium]|jgi:hypothetical protein|nr:hypothetical protein [Myxococcota bacterium]
MRFSIRQMFIVGLMFLPRAVLAITNTAGQNQGGGGGSGLAIVSDSLSTGAVCLVMLVVMGIYLLRGFLLNPKETLQRQE